MRAIGALVIVMALLLTACGSSSSKRSIPTIAAPAAVEDLKSDSSLTLDEQKYVSELLTIMENYSSGTKDGGALLMEAGQDNSRLFDQDWKDKMVAALAFIKANSTWTRDLTPPARFKAAHQDLLALATQMERMTTLVAEGVDELDADKFDQATVTMGEAQQTMEKLASAIVLAAETGAQTAASTAKANKNANLRGGPGTTFAVAGSVTVGQALKIVAKNKAGDWYQLADGKWIAAFLVDAPPAGLPIAGVTTVAPTKAAAATTRPAAQASKPVANKNANLRSGPGTTFAVGGSTKAGQTLEIVGRNEAGDWYQLVNGLWIAKFLVDNAPANLPVTVGIAKTPTSITPRPTATPRKRTLLPGLRPADVTENMKSRGFDCTGVQESQDYLVWSCTRNSADVTLKVDVYGRTLLSVDMIEAVSMQSSEPDDSLSADFLGFVATMPYDGAKPDEARAWIEETLPTLQGQGDVRTATFGGVEYRLYGIPTARNLEIGTLR